MRFAVETLKHIFNLSFDENKIQKVKSKLKNYEVSCFLIKFINIVSFCRMTQDGRDTGFNVSSDIPRRLLTNFVVLCHRIRTRSLRFPVAVIVHTSVALSNFMDSESHIL